MNLTEATAHTAPYTWAAVLLAHAFIGVVAWQMLSRVIGMSIVTAQVIAVVYFIAWEAIIQRLQAGITDALVDTLGVAVGASMAWGLSAGDVWHRAKNVAIIAAVGLVGVWWLS